MGSKRSGNPAVECLAGALRESLTWWLIEEPKAQGRTAFRVPTMISGGGLYAWRKIAGEREALEVIDAAIGEAIDREGRKVVADAKAG